MTQTTMTQGQRELMYAGTEILKTFGFHWDGRPAKKVNTAQVGFENRMPRNPFSGRSTRKKRCPFSFGHKVASREGGVMKTTAMITGKPVPAFGVNASPELAAQCNMGNLVYEPSMHEAQASRPPWSLHDECWHMNDNSLEGLKEGWKLTKRVNSLLDLSLDFGQPFNKEAVAVVSDRTDLITLTALVVVRHRVEHGFGSTVAVDFATRGATGTWPYGYICPMCGQPATDVECHGQPPCLWREDYGIQSAEVTRRVWSVRDGTAPDDLRSRAEGAGLWLDQRVELVNNWLYAGEV